MITRDQAATLHSIGGTSNVLTWGTNPAAGSKVIIAVTTGNNVTATNVVDNGTTPTTFTLDKTVNAGAHPLYIYRADGITQPSAGSYTVTVTWSAASGGSTGWGESYLGAAAGGPSGSNTGTGTSTSVTTNNATPAAAGALFFAAFGDLSGVNPETITLTGTGFTDEADQKNGATFLCAGFADKIDAAGPTATPCTWTLGDSIAWWAAIAAYDAAGTTASAQVATVSATAPQPTVATTASVAAATAGATAVQPTVTTSGSATANAIVATVSAVAPGADPAVGVNAGAAIVSVTAPGAGAAISTSARAAAVSTAALNPTVAAGAATSANAVVATVGASAGAITAAPYLIGSAMAANSATASVTAVPAAGTGIFAFFGSNGSSGSPGGGGLFAAITDTKSGTWAPVAGASETLVQASYVYQRTSGAALTQSDSVTVTVTGSGFIVGVAVAGIPGYSSTDQAGNNNGPTTSSPSVSTAGATGQPGETALSMFFTTGGSLGLTWDTPWQSLVRLHTTGPYLDFAWAPLPTAAVATGSGTCTAANFGATIITAIRGTSVTSAPAVVATVAATAVQPTVTTPGNTQALPGVAAVSAAAVPAVMPGRWAAPVFQQINVNSSGYAGRSVTSAIQATHADFPGGGSPQTQQALPASFEDITDYLQKFPWPAVVGFMSTTFVTPPSVTGVTGCLASLYLGTGVGSMTDFDTHGKPFNKRAVTDPASLTSLTVPAGSWPGAPLMPNGAAAIPAVPVIAWNLGSASLAGIAAGAHDADTLIPVANQCKAWPADASGNPAYPGQPGGQVLIRLMHEFNGPWALTCPATQGETVNDFVAAWQHIVRVFAAQGATNARWVWAPNIASSGAGTVGPSPWNVTSGTVALMYPGDAYVDYIGMDGYNKFVPTWRTFHDLFAGTYNWITAGDAFTGGPISSTKPMIITEFSSYEGDNFTSPPQTKGQFFADIASVVATSFPLVQGVMIWHTPNDALEWPATSSAAATTAWDTLARTTWGGRPTVIQGVTAALAVSAPAGVAAVTATGGPATVATPRNAPAAGAAAAISATRATVGLAVNASVATVAAAATQPAASIGLTGRAAAVASAAMAAGASAGASARVAAVAVTAVTPRAGVKTGGGVATVSALAPTVNFRPPADVTLAVGATKGGTTTAGATHSGEMTIAATRLSMAVGSTGQTGLLLTVGATAGSAGIGVSTTTKAGKSVAGTKQGLAAGNIKAER